MEPKTAYDEMMEDKEFARLMAQEDLIMDVTEAFCEILEERNISRSRLARMMGKTKSYISQILNGSRNLTLRTIADMAFCLGYKVEINIKKRSAQNRQERHEMWANWRRKPGKQVVVSDGQVAPDDYSPDIIDRLAG